MSLSTSLWGPVWLRAKMEDSGPGGMGYSLAESTEFFVRVSLSKTGLLQTSHYTCTYPHTVQTSINPFLHTKF